jgi:hypothetical protein
MNRISDIKKLPDRKITEQLIRERAAQKSSTSADGEGVANCLPGQCSPPV